MEEKLCTIAELANIAGLSKNRMYAFMGRYGFDEFRTMGKNKKRIMQMYKLNKKLAYKLCDLFETINRQDCIEKLVDYCESLGM
nr:MAG TPA: hypothetical protein [Caudoviricetes sp.]